MTSEDPLLSPFQLRHLTLKNRIVSTSHTIQDAGRIERHVDQA